jgi:hypothetical protein
MSYDYKRMTPSIQRQALARQNFQCASCGRYISKIGQEGQESHDFLESAHGHHMIPNMMGGPPTVENCVVLCQSCHLNAHQGGSWKDISIYSDLKELSMAKKIEKIAALYPHYWGKSWQRSRSR